MWQLLKVNANYLLLDFSHHRQESEKSVGRWIAARSLLSLGIVTVLSCGQTSGNIPLLKTGLDF